MSQTSRALRQRVRQHVAAHVGQRLLPDSGAVEDLVDALSRRRDRRMYLLEVPLQGGAPSGAWMPLDGADYLLYPESASPTRRDAVICHELAHILLAHDPALHASLSTAALSAIAPSVSPAAARAVLYRTGYTTSEEAAAEFVGTLLAAGLHERRQIRKWETSSRISERLR